MPCLSGLGEEALTVICQIATLRDIPKNDIIFTESYPADSFFIIRSGAVKLYKTSAEGRELTIKVMAPGDYFCCAPIYEDGRYPVSAVALRDSTLVVIPAEEFKEMLGSSVSGLGMKIISSLCARIRTLSNLVEDLTFKDVEQRIIMALVRLVEEKSARTQLVPLTVTHQDLAAITGTVREVVSRTMSRLKKEQVIVDSSVRGFTIDRERLLRFLETKYSRPYIPVEQ